LDNVVYNKASSQPDLQQLLRAFVAAGQQEQLNSTIN
jgi:hypothetical protein